MGDRSEASRVLAIRLASHGLTEGFGSIDAVVERLGLVQAQDFGAARWVLGSRVPGSTVDEVHRALEGRRIVRSWPVRGTLHVLPSRLLRPILAITGPREVARAALRHRQLELGADDYRAARDIAESLLAGDSASRDELFAAWEAAGIATASQRGYHLIWWLALDAVVCCGPVEGRGQRFVLVDDWLGGGAAAFDREATLGDLFAIYAAGHGPASVRDFAWWTGLTLTDARAARATAGDRVEVFDEVDGDERLVSAVAPSASDASPQARGVHALAAFDEYYLGYTKRDVVCDPEYTERIVPGRNGVFQPILVRDGRVVGTWRRFGRPAAPGIEVRPFGAASARLAQQFKRPLAEWARFSGVTLGDVRLER